MGKLETIVQSIRLNYLHSSKRLLLTCKEKRNKVSLVLDLQPKNTKIT